MRGDESMRRLDRRTKVGIVVASLITGILATSRDDAMGQSTHVQTGFATLQGGQLYYEESGSGAVIVLIHGGVMDRRMWDDQFGVLARDFRVIRYDVPGFGKSPRRQSQYMPSEDLRELLQVLGVDQACVVGLSFGGGIAIDFALTYPELTTALIVAEPGVAGYQFSAEVMQVMREVLSAAQQGDQEGAIQAFLKGPAFSQARANPAAIKKIEGLVRDNFAGMTAQMAVRFQQPRAIDELTRISVPTLVMTSEHAGLDARRIAERIVADVPNVTRVQIPGAGHMMNLEQPEAFNRALLQYLRWTLTASPDR